MINPHLNSNVFSQTIAAIGGFQTRTGIIVALAQFRNEIRGFARDVHKKLLEAPILTHFSSLFWLERLARYGVSFLGCSVSALKIFSFLAAEDFAYTMKNTKCAALVGETTSGGADAGNRHCLNAHLIMNVTDARPINPITKTNWEGIGTAPDIAVSAKKSLDVARLEIVKDLIANHQDVRVQNAAKRCIAEF